MLPVDDFTPKEVERQDLVDNAIHRLLCELSGRKLPWDIELIGEVRDAVQMTFESHTIMTGKEFYPFRSW